MPFVLTQFDQTGNVAFANHFRINDFDASAQFNALRGRNAVDLIRVTQQYAGCDTTFSTDAAAALTVRGSSPSGRTTRLPALRASSVSW
jgi:hypothetical protein